MTDDGFHLRPLHRQRSPRHKPARVLGQQELAELLRVAPEDVKARLVTLGWRFHEDSLGAIWATEQPLPDPPPDRSPAR